MEMMRGQIDMWKSLDIDKSLNELRGRMVNFDNIQTSVNEAVRYEFTKANTLTEEIVKHIRLLVAPGGEIQTSIESIVSMGLAASDARINNGMTEIANVKTKVIAIESVITSQGSSASGVTGGSRKGKVLLEYHVVK
jgi:hypothetical protein